MPLDAMRLALQTLQHINSVEHPVHTTVLPGEIELAIEALHRAIERHTPVAWFHPVSMRVRFEDPKSLLWMPLFK